MRIGSHRSGLSVAALALSFALMSGCTDTRFAYKPGPTAGGVQGVPVKVAVLPFEDGTEKGAELGGRILDSGHYKSNLAQSGISGLVTALTPELWAKAFADDLAASGVFRATRFVYGPSELADEDFIVEGTVEMAYEGGPPGRWGEFALALRALRRTDRRPVWEKGVQRIVKTRWDLLEGCGRLDHQCQVDRYHAKINEVMRGLFSEAGADLLEKLASLSGSPAGEDGLTPAATPAPPALDSADKEIERILKRR
jgi:hypothetical protein